MREPDIYGFNNSDSEALTRLIDQKGFTSSNRPIVVPEHCLIAVATTGVTARSSLILGSGVVAVKHLTETGSGMSIVDSGRTVTAYNLAATAVASGSYIILHQVNKRWIVLWEECVE
jgi:hypothetical protein